MQSSSRASSPDASSCADNDSYSDGLFDRTSRPYRLGNIARVHPSQAVARTISQTQLSESPASPQKQASVLSDNGSQTLEQQSQPSSVKLNQKEKELDALKRQLVTLGADLQRTREAKETDELRIDSKVSDYKKRRRAYMRPKENWKPRPNSSLKISRIYARRSKTFKTPIQT